ncbi:hypothetical protein FGG90_12330 [Clavibacter tessellarius]|uniref:Uncharacterized protein n=1 Tax=Clavibacter tessellarius TaxID=31965 RepID=A0A225C5U0_9MICO|nr:hypothetical protein [Clavibacter michiganensis]OQJ62297.1 hypothetical protein B5P24_04375 [Clavibacter michiganensis subsp. tessellarius]UKF34703.1 hypothetical protein FGG90_12330 [Clavibacter michiganensis subsp. tessellarius]
MTATPLVELRPRSASSPAARREADRGRDRARVAGRSRRVDPAPDDRRDDLVWRSGRLELHLRRAADGPVVLARLVAGCVETVVAEPVPLVDALVAEGVGTGVGSGSGVGSGVAAAVGSGVAAAVGADLRYVAHSVSADGATLVLVQATAAGIRVTATLHGRDGALRSTVVVTNGTGAPVRVAAVTCWAAPLGVRLDKGDVPDPAADWELLEGRVDAAGVERWSARALRSGELLPCPGAGGAGGAGAGRGSVDRALAAALGTGTGPALPVAALLSERQEVAWLWEVAADASWRWQVLEGTADCRLALSRPAPAEPTTAAPLAPGASTAPASALLAVGADLEDAAAALTRARRAEHRASGAIPSDRVHDATGIATAALSTLPEETRIPVRLRSDMTTAETTAALVAGLAGVLHLDADDADDADDALRPDQRALAADALRVADDLRDGLTRSVPLWPRGVPAGDDHVTCAARDTGDAVVVAIDLGDADAALLSFPSLLGRRVDVVLVFPRVPEGGAAGGDAEWDAVRGILTVRSAPGGPSARVLELRRRA